MTGWNSSEDFKEKKKKRKRKKKRRQVYDLSFSK